MNITKIINQLAYAVYISTLIPKPQIELLSVTSMQAYVALTDLNIKMLRPGFMLDTHQPYYYTKSEDWAEVFNYIYFVFDMPPYIVARMDCEDFAILFKGLVSALFGLNYFGLIFGWVSQGYHGWNLFQTEQGFLQLEPQSGKFFKLREKSYLPEYILI